MTLPVNPILWLRPEELTPQPDGNPITLWPPGPVTFFGGAPPAATPAPLYLKDVATGLLGGAWEVGTAPFQQLEFTAACNLPGDFTIYVVGRSIDAVLRGPGLHDSLGQTFFAAQNDGTFIITDGGTISEAASLSAGAIGLWTLRRQAGVILLAKNGVEVTSQGGMDGVVALGKWFAARAPSVLSAGRCWMPELLVYPRALSSAEDEAASLYFQGRYGF